MGKIFYQVFNQNQKRIFPRLSFLTKENFYLAGGTALALQLNHRTSLDFDFYTKSHFDKDLLLVKLKEIFPQTVEETGKAKDTLFVRIDKVNSSFFWYKYPLVSPLLKSNGPLIASLKDIAAMKLIAITGRATERDYIDIFYLIKVFDLKQMFDFTKNKYRSFNPYYIRRSLSFFEDVKKESGRIEIFDKNFSWEKAKEKIFEEVKKYQLAMIKK